MPHFVHGCFSKFPLVKKKLNLSLKKLNANVSILVYINWLPASDRIEYCIVSPVVKYWNGIVPRYIHEMFKPSLWRHSASSHGIGHAFAENKYRTKKLIHLRAKNKANINCTLISRVLKHRLLLCMLLRKTFYFICKHRLIQILTIFF